MASAKRSAAEIDRLRIHQATLFLRSVRQRQHPQPQPEKAGLLVKNRLQELERQLLLDDEDDNNDAGLSISGVTNNEWSENMESLLAPSPPITTTTASSTSSSNSSCSQTSAAATRQILLNSASAIVEANTDAAVQILTNLSGSPRETDQKFIDCMIQALLKRIDPALSIDDQYPVRELCSIDHMEDTHILYRSSPCHRLGILAANLAIIDAVRDLPKIHILDFDFGDGSQYLSLLDSLAGNRSSCPRQIRITAVADPQNPYSMNTIKAAELPGLGDRVERLAERKGFRISFRVAALRASELTRAAITFGTDEALVANFAFVLSRIADESVTPANPRDELLRAVRQMEPRVVALVEEDMNCNTAPLNVRVAEASAHYWAMAETVDIAGLDRGRVEGCMGRKAGNVVGEEGWRRVERCEVFGKWRARMGMAGFRTSHIGGRAVGSLRNRVESGWTVEEEADGVKVVWKRRAMVAASAWH